VVMSPAGLGPENECAGKSQQQLQTTNPFSHQRGCYIRTMTTGVQLTKKNSGHESQEAQCQDELIGGNPPVVGLRHS
jgi:hypothetical protein